MRQILVLFAIPLLAACNAKSDKDQADVTIEKSVTVTADDDKAAAALGGEHGFKIDTNKFKASLDIPGLEMGGKNFNIDDMTLLPGTQVRGMKVMASDKDGDKSGIVTITFVSPGTPAAVLDHAEAQAKKEGWSVARTADGLGGTRKDKTIAYKVAASGTQTAGTVTVTGED